MLCCEANRGRRWTVTYSTILMIVTVKSSLKVLIVFQLARSL